MIGRTIITLIAILLPVACMSAACIPTGQRPYGAPGANPTDFDRDIEVDLSNAYFAQLPDCVTILPGSSGEGRPFADAAVLEAALTRHARDRFARVIGGAERRALSDRLLVDLSVGEDRAYYARRTRCGHFLTFAPWGGADLYALVYSRKAVGIDAGLIEAQNDVPLWRARHVAVRSDGSLPLSPFGALVGAFEAARLESDADLPESMADDAARRLIATIPDVGNGPGGPDLTPGGVLRSDASYLGD